MTQTVARQSASQTEKLVKVGLEGKAKTGEGRWKESPVEPHDAGSVPSRSAAAPQAKSSALPGKAESAQIKTRDAGHEVPPIEHVCSSTNRSSRSQIKTKDIYVRRQVPNGNDGAGISRQRNFTGDGTIPCQEASRPGQEPTHPLEQGHQKLVRERQNKATVQQRESRGKVVDPVSAPVQQRCGENVPSKPSVFETVGNGTGKRAGRNRNHLYHHPPRRAPGEASGIDR